MQQELNSMQEIDKELERLFSRVLAFEQGRDDRMPIHKELMNLIRGGGASEIRVQRTLNLLERLHGHPVPLPNFLVRRQEQKEVNSEERYEMEQRKEEFVKWAVDNPHSSFSHFLQFKKEDEKRNEKELALQARNEELDELSKTLKGQTIDCMKILDYGNMESYDEYSPPRLLLVFKNGAELAIDY